MMIILLFLAPLYQEWASKGSKIEGKCSRGGWNPKETWFKICEGEVGLTQYRIAEIDVVEGKKSPLGTCTSPKRIPKIVRKRMLESLNEVYEGDQPIMLRVSLDCVADADSLNNSAAIVGLWELSSPDGRRVALGSWRLRRPDLTTIWDELPTFWQSQLGYAE